ncbi:MAG: right-handed parallel beta-helix repeat-containing protein [Akkermansiaceae bacterium]|nr:right-handed parallel beta-helix repeat-containing protein [Armatimonadota bacterium]
MFQFLSRVFPLSVVLTIAVACVPDAASTLASAVSPAPASPATVTHGSLLLKQDFGGTNGWHGLSATGAGATALRKAVGTIDVANTTTASDAALLTVNKTAMREKTWGAALISGLLPVSNRETNLIKLTLSFDHSVSSLRPITVRVESFDASKKRTGGREGVVYPAAPDFYLRSAVELSTMKPFGGGAFKPTSPFLRITFTINNLPDDATKTGTTKLRVDNVAYASPAYYVSPKGKDTNDGRTEKTAFATPQKAIDAAQPGDIVLVMDGTYMPHDVQDGVVAFRRPGTPAAWITLKNYPGHRPLLSPIGAWNAIRIGQRGTKEMPSKEPALAYLEVRGFIMRGEADLAKEKFADKVGKPDPNTNNNGVNITSRYESQIPHHIRVADNVIEYCGGGGTSGAGDWITIENNIVRNNCWWTIYAGSGISFNGLANFDAADNAYKILVRNNVASGNRCFVAWGRVKRISDGNGIIIDTNYVPAKNKVYFGRTLVQSNLTFNNGGSGIHAFRSHRVDIINNTAYYNGASPELNWGQIFV